MEQKELPQELPQELQPQELLRGIAPEWDPILNDPQENPQEALCHTLAAISEDVKSLEPPSQLMFEALRYACPLEINFVMIGQDPYPQDAMGLCFSARANLGIPVSLRNIFGALVTSKAIKEDGHVVPDLRSWAAQGGLLLNASLTNRTGARRAHKTAWDQSEFVPKLVNALARHCAQHGRRISFLLWGNDARALDKGIIAATTNEDLPSYHQILYWTHPSPMSDNRLPDVSKFKNCPHFLEVNALQEKEGRRKIEWNPLAPTIAFTDGGCKGNGTPDADAAFAVFIASGPAGKTTLCGRVEPYPYRLVNADVPEEGFEPCCDEGEPCPPSNNRGEYLAWCWCLLLLIRARALGKCEIVSDSMLFIQTMNRWLPTRRAKGTAEQLKNYDLVVIAEALLIALRKQCAFGPSGIVLTHVKAAHDTKKPAVTAPPRDQLFWHGNDRADKLADSVIGGKRDPQVEVSQRTYNPVLNTGTPVLRRLVQF